MQRRQTFSDKEEFRHEMKELRVRGDIYQHALSLRYV